MLKPVFGIVEDDLVDAVERSDLRQEPFDHIYMSDVVSPSTYETLLARMPDRHFYHELRHQDAMLPDGHSTRFRMYLYPELLRHLPTEQRAVWRAVGRALCSPRLERALRLKFRTAIQRRFDKPVGRIGLYPVPILLRDQPGYRIGIHADSPTKAITVQFYLPADERQRHLGTVFHEGDRGERAKRTTQMPFLPASGYAFPVSLTESWHSAARTSESDGERVSMMVTYYVADGVWSRLKYRLRRAALRFGIHPKG
jgi:hypothetical protein